MRILRAGIGTWFIVEFARTNDWMFLAFGGLFAMQALFNVGCCGASGCAATPKASQQVTPAQEISYEEVGDDRR